MTEVKTLLNEKFLIEILYKSIEKTLLYLAVDYFQNLKIKTKFMEM